jgi:hypothetical protein
METVEGKGINYIGVGLGVRLRRALQGIRE